MKHTSMIRLFTALSLSPFLLTSSIQSTHAQSFYGPLSYFNAGGSDRVFLHPLPTAWFAVRFSPQWEARIDSAYIMFGIQKNNSPSFIDTLEVRILDSTLPTITVLDYVSIAIPSNLQGQIPDNYWVIEFDFLSPPPALIRPPRDFWMSWRIKGASVNFARILLKTPAAEPARSVVINANGTTTTMTTFVRPSITDTVDLVAEVRALFTVPVELQSFSAEYIDGKGVLQWTTASETGNYGFEVYRSAGSSESGSINLWQRIGFVHGHGTTTKKQEYRFVDPQPHETMDESGVVRYRLKQIDFDGTFEFSPVQEIRIPSHAGGFELSAVYPNPSALDGRISVDAIIPESGFVTVQVTDVLGRPVARLTEGTLNAGRHTFSFGTEGLTTGVYWVSLRAGDVHVVRRFTRTE